MKNFLGYIETLWMHTPKAVKACANSGGIFSAPDDRVFAVTRIEIFKGKQYLVAWKCELLPNGMLKHPGYKRPLSPDDTRLFSNKARNGAEPTADFKPGDSFYRQVTPELLKKTGGKKHGYQ